ncbi:MAG: prenyltransferase/squalene oxidase repeat-containing protein [bacterium]
MKLQNGMDDAVSRVGRFIKERGWGPLGSFAFHVLALMLILGFASSQLGERDFEVGPIIMDTHATDPALEPLETKPSEPEDPSVEMPVDENPDVSARLYVAAADQDSEMPGDSATTGGVGGGSADFGIGDGTAADGVGFAVAYSRSPLVMSGLYESRRAGGQSGRLSAIKRGRVSLESETAVLNALRWLQANQNADGSWSGAGSPTAMCGLALLCYLAHGETPNSREFGATVEKAMRYLMYAQDPATGRFKDAGANYVYGHAIATYALAECYGMTEMVILKEPMEKAVQVIIDGQQNGGAFDYGYAKDSRRDMSVTGWQVQALEAAKLARAENKGLQECLYKCVAGIRSFSGPVGGFGYDGPGAAPTLAGAGIFCLQLLERADDPAVAITFAAARDMVPTWPKGGGGTYGWYYMTQAAYMKGDKVWTEWGKVLFPMLIKNQAKDGHWESGSTHSACSVYDTALCCLCLEVTYKWSSILAKPDEVRRVSNGRVEADEKLSRMITL